jgi:uncharacterized protein with von Willebrand factor type A (vWA) domain
VTATPAIPDLSYRVVDSMFTAFYPNTPDGVKAWKIIAAHNNGTGMVLATHVDSTIRQLRDAGYSVNKTATSNLDDDELLASLVAN